MVSYNLAKKIVPLKALVLDVDGVLTPGGIWYSDSGDQFKPFDVKDGLGIVALGRLGILTAIVTGKQSALLDKRAGELRVTDLYQNRPYKMPVLIEFAEKHGLEMSEIGFVGDDVIDIPVMNACGFSACPSDAAFAVRRNADWVSRYTGGKGALREIVEIIVSAKTGLYPPDEFFADWVDELIIKS
jgi:3-deoxy-D-manno-octulosonate 8-phosphate phosphatase (KDO 8-P phosphatase)